VCGPRAKSRAERRGCPRALSLWAVARGHPGTPSAASRRPIRRLCLRLLGLRFAAVFAAVLTSVRASSRRQKHRPRGGTRDEERERHTQSENLPVWVRVSPLFARVRGVQKAGQGVTPSAHRLEIVGHLWRSLSEHIPILGTWFYRLVIRTSKNLGTIALLTFAGAVLTQEIKLSFSGERVNEKRPLSFCFL